MLTESTPYLLPLASVSMADYQRIGRKAAVLGELAQAGLPTPLGFCLTVAAFHRFLLASNNPSSPSQSPTANEKTPIPTEISESILRLWDKVGSSQPYVVQLSPLMQGQTAVQPFLNVRGPDALLDSIRRCWLAHLHLANQPVAPKKNQPAGTAVLIQPMLSASRSGTLYTADPHSGSRDIAVIDTGYGLAATAMHQHLNKQTGELISTTNSHLVTPVSPEEAAMLVALGQQVETHFGQPHTVSWLREENGRFFLLNAAPLTTLFPLPQPQPKDESVRLYLNLNQLTDSPKPLPILAQSVWRILFPLGKAGSPISESRLISSAGGRLFFDFTDLLGSRLSRRWLTRFLHQHRPTMLTDLRQLAKKYRLKPNGRSLRRPLFPLLADAVADLFWRDPEGVGIAIAEWATEYVRETQANLSAYPAGAPRLRALRTTLADAYGEAVRPILATVLSGVAAHALLAKLVQPQAAPEDLAILQRGLPSQAANNIDLELADFALLLQSSPNLADHFQAHDPNEAISSLETLEEGPQFLLRWAEFLLRFGMFGGTLLDISQPRWQEAPEPLVRRLKRQLSAPSNEGHRQQRQLHRASEAAADRLLVAARHGLLGEWRQRLAGRLLRVIQHAASAQLHLETMLQRLMLVVRQRLLAEGRRMEGNGRFAHANDVWHLTLTELIRAADDPTLNLQPLIAKRQAELLQQQALAAPNLISSKGDVPTVQRSAQATPAGALTGQGVATGICEGMARVITDPLTAQVVPGEIVIASAADVALAPFYAQAAGVVMERGETTGGETAVCSYGIPVVSGIANATRAIKTGQFIRVHGDLGYVEILA